MFACLGKIDLTDYLHSDRSFIIGCSGLLKFFHDTSTLESSQRLDHSRVKSASILGRRIGLPEPSAGPRFLVALCSNPDLAWTDSVAAA